MGEISFFFPPPPPDPPIHRGTQDRDDAWRNVASPGCVRRAHNRWSLVLLLWSVGLTPPGGGVVSINDDRLTLVNCKNEKKKKKKNHSHGQVRASPPLSLPCCPALLDGNIFKDADLAQQQQQQEQQQLSPPPPPPEEITLREADLEGGAT